MPSADCPGWISVSRRSGADAIFFQFGVGRVEVREIVLLDGAGGEELTVLGDEGGGEVLEEDGEFEVVVDVDGGEDVEIVLGCAAADDVELAVAGVTFEDCVGGEDADVGSRNVDGDGGRQTHIDREGRAEDDESQQDGNEIVARGRLGEFEVGHRALG